MMIKIAQINSLNSTVKRTSLWDLINTYNQLTNEIKNERSDEKFKTKLSEFIKLD